MSNSKPSAVENDARGDRPLIAADDGSAGRTVSVPSDNTSLLAVLGGLTEQGYAAQFEVVEGGQLWCEACSAISSAGSFDIDTVRRLEGASDPDDMVSVIAARCPRCGALGTSVLGFGPASSAEDTDVSIAIARVATRRRMMCTPAPTWDERQ